MKIMLLMNWDMTICTGRGRVKGSPVLHIDIEREQPVGDLGKRVENLGFLLL